MFGLFKKKEPAAPTPGAASITTFLPGDGVGTVTLAAGAVLRFGASACQGFVPAVGLEVQVLEVQPHPLGGFKAARIGLAESERGEADALADAQDVALGAGPASLAQEAATALQLGDLVVLLERAPAAGRAGARAFFEESQLASLGCVLEEGPEPALRFGTERLRLLLGHATMPDEGLDRRHAPEAPLGKGFVVVLGGVPGLGVTLRRSTQSAPDGFAPAGRLRLATRLARHLLEKGLASAVVVPRAGNVVRGAEEFLRLTHGAASPLIRPFAAWVDLGLSEGVLRVSGLDAFWLPDVECPAALDGLSEEEAYARAHEAALFACHRMVHTNRALEPGTELAVPLGVEVGSGRLEDDNADLAQAPVARWRVESGADSPSASRAIEAPKPGSSESTGAMPQPEAVEQSQGATRSEAMGLSTPAARRSEPPRPTAALPEATTGNGAASGPAAPSARSAALIRLVPAELIAPLSALWAKATAAGDLLPYPLYRELLRAAFEQQGAKVIARLDGHGAIAHEVLVLRRATGDFTLVTCGLARAAQPGGTDAEGNRHLEVQVRLDDHAPAIAQTLSSLGRAFHERGTDAPPIGAGHRMLFEQRLPPLGLSCVAYAAGGSVSFGAGPAVSLLTALVMTEAERAEVPPSALVAWTREAMQRPEVVGRWLTLARVR